MLLPPSRRVLSVDVLRGVTIAFMILVNDAGDGRHMYPPLAHAEWNGWTWTDMVFPTFLFLIGASLIFSLHSRIARGDSHARLAAHMVRRAAIIFFLDLLFSAYPHFHLTHLRIFGVLTRIAACYLAAGLILLTTRRVSHLAAITAVLLVGYWALLRFVPVPGFGMPVRDVSLLDPVGNLTSWMDRGFTNLTQHYLHTGRLYRGVRDPEGILSTLPSIATVLLGAITALYMRMDRYAATTKCVGFAVAGAVSIAAGELWNLSFPFNKNMWTSSYVLLAAGIALLGLALAYWLIDILRLQAKSSMGRAVLWPWFVFGANAIAAYLVSEFLAENLTWIKLNDDGTTVTVWNWIYQHVFARGNSTDFTSFAFALSYVLVCFFFSWLLWRKQIFIKI